MISAISRRKLSIALATSCIAAPVFAQSKKGPSTDPLTVEVSGIVVPVANGQALVSYLFCIVSIQVGDAGSALYLRENQFVLKDALVRIGSRAPIPAGAAPQTYNRGALTQLVLRAVAAIRPNTRVVRVDILQAEFMRR